MKSSKNGFKVTYSIDQSTKSKVQEYSPHISPVLLMNQLLKGLYTKYDDCSSACNLKYTESIIKATPKSYYIKFKDYKDYDLSKENIEEIHEGEEINLKFEEVIGYYVFYEDIPRMFMEQLSVIVNKRIEQQRVLRYKALKNTLGIAEEELKQSVKEIIDFTDSKCLPTGILLDQTENSIRSIVKKLSVLIYEQQQKQQKYALTQGCLTLMRTNKKKLNIAHKLNTVECAKSKSRQKDMIKSKKNCKQNRKTQFPTEKMSIKKSRPVSGNKQYKKITTRASSSKRKQSNKSVQDLIKKHMRHNTKSPQLIQKTLKKKHIRMFSSQPDETYTTTKKIKKTTGKIQYQQLCLQNNSKQKQKPSTFLKKKTRCQA